MQISKKIQEKSKIPKFSPWREWSLLERVVDGGRLLEDVPQSHCHATDEFLMKENTEKRYHFIFLIHSCSTIVVDRILLVGNVI